MKEYQHHSTVKRGVLQNFPEWLDTQSSRAESTSKLVAVADEGLLGCGLAEVLDLLDPFDAAGEHHGRPVELAGLGLGEEELRAVGGRATVRLGQDFRARVL